MVSCDKYGVYGHTCIGYAHVRNGCACQDFSMTGEGKYYKFAVVCDGHGGADYFRSDRGSRLACEIFAAGVREALFLRKFRCARDDAEREMLLSGFAKSLITRWNIAIESDIASDPIRAEELDGVGEAAREAYTKGERLCAIYGTTLIGFALVGNFCFGMQIGDGRCTVRGRDGILCEPIPSDPDCFMNITSSLSGENAYEKTRFFISHKNREDYPAAVLLCSDGVCDSFSEKGYYDFVRTVLDNLWDSVDERELYDYLPTLSEKGSGDDMSLCVIISKEK